MPVPVDNTPSLTAALTDLIQLYNNGTLSSKINFTVLYLSLPNTTGNGLNYSGVPQSILDGLNASIGKSVGPPGSGSGTGSGPGSGSGTGSEPGTGANGNSTTGGAGGTSTGTGGSGSSDSSGSGSSSISTGAIAGIVIGSVVFVALVAAVLVFAIRNKSRALIRPFNSFRKKDTDASKGAGSAPGGEPSQEPAPPLGSNALMSFRWACLLIPASRLLAQGFQCFRVFVVLHWPRSAHVAPHCLHLTTPLLAPV